MEEIKLKDMPIKLKIAERHKTFLNSLYIITFCIFLPFLILGVCSEGITYICEKVAVLRNNIVHTIFKIVYKKEIIEYEKELEIWKK